MPKERRLLVLRCDTFGGTGNDHCDPIVVPLDSRSHARSNRSCIQPVTTTPSTDPATSALSMNRLKPLSLRIHVFGGIFEQMLPLVSNNAVVWHVSASCNTLAQELRYQTHFHYRHPSDQSTMSCIHAIPSAIQLSICSTTIYFSSYLTAIDWMINWNARLEWRKLSQVCQRWRHLVHGSSFRLGLQILCTNGTPLVDTLLHLPPLPLVVDYQYATATMGAQDKLVIFHALQLRDRLRHIVLRIPPSNLCQLLLFMDVPFLVLERLSLSSSAEEGTILLLYKTLLAPNL